MICFFRKILVGLLLATSAAQAAIHSGVPWYDDHGNTVSARGAGLIKEGDRFYLFGEIKEDHGNAFVGFSCYSSPDLANWTFESIALPVQPDGPLGPGRVGERPKVLKNPRTGEFVMFMHTDNAAYKDQAVGYATSPTVTGPYTFRGPLLFNNQPVKKWDMGVFQDDDGTGYLITHSGNLYALADDYKSVTRQVVKDMTPHCEAPAIFKRNGLYYWLGSGLTGWERNDNYYFTATSPAGPWEPQGIFAPKDTLTWNSQTTFVLPVVGYETTTYLFMGDRWAHPFQNSAATCVWQPLQFSADGKLSLPEFQQSWNLDTRTGRWSPATLDGTPIPLPTAEGWTPYTDTAGFTDLRSNVKGATLTIPFTGSQIALHGVARSDGGFGQIQIKDRAGKVVLTSIIESYCLYPEASLKFLSPKLPPGDYTLTVTVLGEHFFWQGKRAAYGSTGDYVSVQKVFVLPASASIADHGAIADGRTINTSAIQSVIDTLATSGGGTVVIPRGVFLSGALFFKPGVNLRLEKDAVLRAISTDVATHFPARRTRIEGHFEDNFTPALINADHCDGLRITGEGTLDGDGRAIWDDFMAKRNAAPDKKNFKNISIPRARLALIENSKDVLIEGVTFKDSQFWNLHLYRNRGVTVRNARFEVPDDYKQAPSTDGIDVDSSQDVTIDGCTFSVTDDCIAMKGSKGPFAMDDKDSPPVEHVRIQNCIFKRGHNAVTLGSEATVVRDVVVENCRVTGAMSVVCFKLRPDTPQTYEDIHYHGLTLDSSGGTLVAVRPWTQYVDLKGLPAPKSVVRNITFSHITGHYGSFGELQGNPGQTDISDIRITDLDIQLKTPRLTTRDVRDLKFVNVRINGTPVPTP
jgi:polygalacturonase